MPGPVSDSSDPEFGTGANAEEVKLAIQSVVRRITKELGPQRKNIIEVVVGGPRGRRRAFGCTEQELRVIRFGLDRALETI